MDQKTIESIVLPNPLEDEERINEAKKERLEKLKERLVALEKELILRENNKISDKPRPNKKVKVDEEMEEIDIE